MSWWRAVNNNEMYQKGVMYVQTTEIDRFKNLLIVWRSRCRRRRDILNSPTFFTHNEEFLEHLNWRNTLLGFVSHLRQPLIFLSKNKLQKKKPFTKILLVINVRFRERSNHLKIEE